MTVQAVRWGYAVMAEDHGGKIVPILRWSMAWPKSTALRHAKQACRLVDDFRSCWIVVGRWTQDAGWSFARADVDVRRTEFHRNFFTATGRHLRAV